MEEIRSPPLSELVSEEIKERLTRGELVPGTRINEKEFAKELGVSRSPLREALIRLEAESLISHESGKGFSVSRLDPEEAQDLYELVGALERLAVRSDWQANDSVFEDLRAINEERRTAENTYSIIQSDTRWHGRLLAQCQNEKLRETIAGLKGQLYRYEQKFINEKEDDSIPIEQHRRITSLLEERKLEKAADLLREHWRRGIEKTARRLAQ